MAEQIRHHEKAGEQPSNHEARKHHERLHTHHEKAGERAPGNHTREVMQARHEIEQEAISGAEHHKPHAEQRQPDAPLTRSDKNHAFDAIMHHARQSLPKTERVFSKFIHRPMVEKTSEILGKTVARPSGLIGAMLAAFAGLLLVYGVAKFAGFQLSGSEMPLLAAVGFVAGLLFEWAYKVIRTIVAPRKSLP